MLLDNGASINIMPLSTLKKPGQDETDLIPVNVVMTNFTGETERSLRVLPDDIAIRGSTMTLAFFVMQ